MSKHDYDVSKQISSEDPTFAALIMAALRKADSQNSALLRRAFPTICLEMEQRYNAPGGLLPGERA